ncbi:MAG: hypothetical protein ACJ8FY_27265 [Gemmataceae bacterium]
MLDQVCPNFARLAMVNSRPLGGFRKGTLAASNSRDMNEGCPLDGVGFGIRDNQSVFQHNHRLWILYSKNLTAGKFDLDNLEGTNIQQLS